MEHFFEKYEKFAYSIVYKQFRYYPEKEDLKQIALLGLWKASKAFKPELNVTFICYANRVICNDIKDYIKSQKKYLLVESSDDCEIGSVQMNLSCLEYDIISRNLSLLDKQLLDDVMFGLKQKEIAIKYGISQATVSQRLKKIKNKLSSMR